MYHLKVAETTVGTAITKTTSDPNVQISQHCTENGRLIGYTIKLKRRGRRFPRVILKDRVLFASYHPDTLRTHRRRVLKPVMCDNNIRIVRFGVIITTAMYVFAVRKRNGPTYEYREGEGG